MQYVYRCCHSSLTMFAHGKPNINPSQCDNKRYWHGWKSFQASPPKKTHTHTYYQLLQYHTLLSLTLVHRTPGGKNTLHDHI